MSPEFSQMGTNMVTSYIMQTYANSQQGNVTSTSTSNPIPSRFANNDAVSSNLVYLIKQNLGSFNLGYDHCSR